METLHTIDTPELTAKLNKSEIDILHFVESWLPTFTDWSVEELSHKCKLFTSDANEAVDMLILHGLLDNAVTCPVIGRRISVSDLAALWLRENRETINDLFIMNNTDLFEDAEIAEG